MEFQKEKKKRDSVTNVFCGPDGMRQQQQRQWCGGSEKNWVNQSQDQSGKYVKLIRFKEGRGITKGIVGCRHLPRRLRAVP